MLQRANDRSLCQRNFESVMREALGLAEDRERDSFKVILGGVHTVQHRLGIRVAPRLMSDTAQSETSFGDRVSVHLERRRHRYQREGIRRTITHLQVGIVVGESSGRQIYRR